MAHYLVVDETGEVPVIHETEGANLMRAIETLAPDVGSKLTVYRMAGPPRKVRLTEVTETKVEIQ